MKLTIQDLLLNGKKVLIRVDFNAPLNKDGTIAETRGSENLSQQSSMHSSRELPSS